MKKSKWNLILLCILYYGIGVAMIYFAMIVKEHIREFDFE